MATVSFEMRVPPGKDAEGKPHPPTEYIRVELDKATVLSRVTTDADRRKYKAEYQAFKAPPKSVDQDSSTRGRLASEKQARGFAAPMKGAIDAVLSGLPGSGKGKA